MSRSLAWHRRTSRTVEPKSSRKRWRCESCRRQRRKQRAAVTEHALLLQRSERTQREGRASAYVQATASSREAMIERNRRSCRKRSCISYLRPDALLGQTHSRAVLLLHERLLIVCDIAAVGWRRRRVYDKNLRRAESLERVKAPATSRQACACCDDLLLLTGLLSSSSATTSLCCCRPPKVVNVHGCEAYVCCLHRQAKVQPAGAVVLAARSRRTFCEARPATVCCSRTCRTCRCR